VTEYPVYCSQPPMDAPRPAPEKTHRVYSKDRLWGGAIQQSDLMTVGDARECLALNRKNGPIGVCYFMEEVA